MIFPFLMQMIFLNLAHWLGSPFNPLYLRNPTKKFPISKLSFGKNSTATSHPGFWAQCFSPSLMLLDVAVSLV